MGDQPEGGNTTARIARLEADVSSVASSVDKLVAHVGALGDKISTIGDKVSSLDASQGRVPVGTIFGSVSLGITFVTIVGALSLNPIKAQVDALEVARKNTVENYIPGLTERIATLTAENAESEREREAFWDLHHSFLEWKGGIDVLTREHELKLLNRVSDDDPAQNARLDAMERELDRREPYVFGATQ